MENVLNVGAYVLVTVIGAGLGFFWHQINTARAELNALKLHVAEEYLRKDDYKEDIRELKDTIRMMFDKIDKLVEQGRA